DEIPLGIVDPIDLDAISEVLLIDSDDDAHIEEIATQSKFKLKSKFQNESKIKNKFIKGREKSDNEVIVENTDVGGNTVGLGVEDMGGNTVDGEHRGGVKDMGVNTDNWSELDPDNLNAEEGYYSTHTSQDGDDGPTQENIDKSDLEFRDLAKEYDNIFTEEEDAVHSVPPQPTYAWNAWSIRKEKIVGSYDEGYIMQSELCLQILHSNPGSIAVISKYHDTSQWTGTCVMFKASINGFLNGCRPTVGLDRYFLKVCYGRFCFKHMYKNMKKVYKGTHLESLVWKAAKAYKQVEKKNLLDELKLDNPSTHDWLMKEPFEHWTRSHFDFTAKCEHITNNFFESFNNWIIKIRDKPLHKSTREIELNVDEINV
ncbi:hypothetical protein GIB67_025788, partial [Kingdonia uniflora]